MSYYRVEVNSLNTPVYRIWGSLELFKSLLIDLFSRTNVLFFLTYVFTFSLQDIIYAMLYNVYYLQDKILGTIAFYMAMKLTLNTL